MSDLSVGEEFEVMSQSGSGCGHLLANPIGWLCLGLVGLMFFCVLGLAFGGV